MVLPLTRTILTLVVAVLLVCIVGANNFANREAGLFFQDVCGGYVAPIKFRGNELCFTHGVTAALFALAAAALLFISLVPVVDGMADRLSEALHRLVSSLAATGAGAYWLLDEAGETAWLHLAVVLFLGAIVVGSAAAPVVMLFPINLLRVWVTRRIRAVRASGLRAKRHKTRRTGLKSKLAHIGTCLLILSVSGVMVLMVIWTLVRITRGRSLLRKS